MALSTVSGILTPLGDGPARPARARAAASATSARGRASSCTSTSRSSVGSRAAPASASAAASASTTTAPSPTPTATSAATVGYEYVHIAVDDHSRLAYAEVLPDEKATTAVGFLRRAVAFYAPLRDQRRAPPHRQRLRLPRDRIHALACRQLGIRTPAHAALPAADERQGRALHPHPPRRLGVRRDLPLKPANAPPPLTAGSGTTTIADDTQPSATNPRSAEPTCSGPTSRARELQGTFPHAARSGRSCSPAAGLGHRGSGFGPVAVTRRCGTQSSTWLKPSKRPSSSSTTSKKERR